MNEKSVSVRITAQEFEALKVLAKRDVRTVSGWIRAKIVSESQKAGIVIGNDDARADSAGGEKQSNLDAGNDTVSKN